AIKREPLKRKPERDPAGADCLRTFGEDRTETLGGALKDTEARIEVIREARGRGRQWHADKLTHNGCTELAEVELEIAVEVREMGLFTGKRCLTVENEAVGAV